MKLSYFSLFAVSGVTADVYTQTGLYLRSYAPSMLSEWLPNSDAVDNVLTHGCFCAKLDSTNPYLEFLGGTDPLDELDELCRNWLRCRNCNDNLSGGSCEANRDAMRTGSYSFLFDRDDYSNTQCGFHASECEEDTCKIDLDNLKAINQYISDNPSFAPTTISGAGTCNPAPLDKHERKCLGEAPAVYPKRMSDLEQLFVRAYWLDDKDAEDSMTYHDGGRKLNDKKEYIEVEVKNQLITFAWPNVQSFTVETVDDYATYSIGFVEKATVNNFQTGDTLGSDTKGGYKTVGIFSGDATVNAFNGASYTNNDGKNFWLEGSTATVIRNSNDDFDFYVNGEYCASIPHDDWNGFYPAIDTDQRLKLRVTDVVFQGDEIPCVNGSSDGYTCTCDAGWEGMACDSEIPIPECGENQQYDPASGQCASCYMQTICPTDYLASQPASCFGGPSSSCISMCQLNEGLGYLKLYEFEVNNGLFEVSNDGGSGLWYDRGGHLGNVPEEMWSTAEHPVYFSRVGIWWQRPMRFHIDGANTSGKVWIYRMFRVNEPAYHDPQYAALEADGYTLVPDAEAGQMYNANSSYGYFKTYKKLVDVNGLLEITTQTQYWSGGVAFKLDCSETA